MVWLLPAAEGSKILAITLVTYLIALGGFTHIVVGSVETLYLVLPENWLSANRLPPSRCPLSPATSSAAA